MCSTEVLSLGLCPLCDLYEHLCGLNSTKPEQIKVVTPSLRVRPKEKRLKFDLVNQRTRRGFEFVLKKRKKAVNMRELRLCLKNLGPIEEIQDPQESEDCVWTKAKIVT